MQRTLATDSHLLRSRSLHRRKLHSERAKAQRTLPEQVVDSLQKLKRQTYASKLLQIISLLIVAIGIAVTISYILQNQTAEKIAEEQINIANEQGGDDGDPNTPQPAVVTPQADNAPSRWEVLQHTTPKDTPKRIEIESLGVFARVDAIGLNEAGEIGVPTNVYDASWFNQSGIVGEDPGSSIIVGHLGFRSIAGVFHKIDRLNQGDKIKVVMGDDREFTYYVTNNASIPLENFAMGQYLSHNNQARPRLHLITCAGSVIPGSTSYDSRIVVSAELL